MSPATVKIELPFHLATLADSSRVIELEVPADATVEQLLDALERRYPMLRGTVRDHTTRKRRPYLRFFACQIDISHDPIDTSLPERVMDGTDVFIILGSVAGG